MTPDFVSQKPTPGIGVKTRLTCTMLVCIFFSAVILLRAAYIQLLRNPRLEGMARRQFQSRSLIRPRRGSILDRNGEPLAVNVETHSLAANPGKIHNKKSVARLLSKSVNIPFSKLFHKFNEKREFVWIKRHLSDAELRRFKKLRVIAAEGDWVDGLWLVKESERMYPHGKLASHILGDVNVDSEGIEGVELWMNDRLRGKVVSVSAIKDALGRPTFIDAVAAKSVQDGQSISLTIDASLQFEIEMELAHSLQRTGARAGTIIVMNAANGEVLAMANEPSFNANEKRVPADKRRNRAVTDGFEPGSTLKALLMAGVLSNGGKMTDQVWGERGSFLVQGHKISEATASEKFEWVDLKKMIQVSSNVAASKFALKLGADRYFKTIQSFGLGSKTGLGFPGEIQGRIPPRKEWGPLALANIGFGQGILVTPLQMTRAYAALVNGGWLVTPSLIKKVQGQKSYSEFSLEGNFTRILSQKVSQEVVEALTSVTEQGGTGMRAALGGYRVAGKTGTAQMVDSLTGRYSHEKYMASFIGFAVEVDPKIVIFVSLTEPQGVYYGAATAAPLFKEVLTSVAHRCNLPIFLDAEKISVDRAVRDQLKLTQAAYQTLVSPEADIVLQRSEAEAHRPSGWIMPSLKGLSPREVVRILKGHRLCLEVVGTGVVSSHLPEEGKAIADGGTIRLMLTEP